MSRHIEFLCSIDIEKSQESFHAHAIPEGVEINPGDIVTIYDAPSDIAFGEHYIGERRGTLIRANALVRLWTQFSSIFEIGELYEVGFSPASEALRAKG
jgi:hypothetical protein